MGRILGGMVYEDSCGCTWPCIGGEFHDFVAGQLVVHILLV